MKRFLWFVLLMFGIITVNAQISIEEVSLKNRLHYRVSTPNAVYFIDRYSGGISEMFDRDGNDWIQWNRMDEEKFPQSAAGDYRGLPNLVYGGNYDGVGHPGFNKAMSFKEGLTKVRVRSIDGKWEFLYSFYPEYVELEILEMPELNHHYWFMYEGVPGGNWQPDDIFWGTDNGLKTAQPDYFKGDEEYGNWQWAFIGNKNAKQTLFLVQKGKDINEDMFGFLGDSSEGLNSKNGMVVFGFGRGKDATPLINKSNTFYFGFYHKSIDEKSFPRLEKYIRKTFFY